MAIQSLRVSLHQYLDVPNIRPYLLANHLLTIEESQELTLLEKTLTKQKQAERTLDIVERKGPRSEDLFFLSLRQSTECDDVHVHLGHTDLLKLYQEWKRKWETNDFSFVFPMAETPVDTYLPQPESGGNDAYRDGIYPPVTSPFRPSPPTPSALYFPQYPVNHLTYTPFNTSLPAYPVEEREPYLQNQVFPNYYPSFYESNSPVLLGDFRAVEEKDWEEAETLKYQIVTESQKIMRKYSDLVLNVCYLLEHLNVQYEYVKMKILHLGCVTHPVLKSTTHMPEVSQAKSIKELLTSLHLYSSWFNYEIVKVIAEDFGGNDGSRLVEDYELSLNEFCHKFIYECPQFMPNLKIPAGFEGFVMKVNKDYYHYTVQDLTIYKTAIVKLTRIEPCHLLLRSVEEGCIKMTWCIPSALVQSVLETVNSHKAVLADIDVQSVNVGGKCLDIRFTSQKLLFPFTSVSQYSLNSQSSYSDTHSDIISPKKVKYNSNTDIEETKNSLDSFAASTLTSLSLDDTPTTTLTSLSLDDTPTTPEQHTFQRKLSSLKTRNSCRSLSLSTSSERSTSGITSHHSSEMLPVTEDGEEFDGKISTLPIVTFDGGRIGKEGVALDTEGETTVDLSSAIHEKKIKSKSLDQAGKLKTRKRPFQMFRNLFRRKSNRKKSSHHNESLTDSGDKRIGDERHRSLSTPSSFALAIPVNDHKTGFNFDSEDRRVGSLSTYYYLKSDTASSIQSKEDPIHDHTSPNSVPTNFPIIDCPKLLQYSVNPDVQEHLKEDGVTSQESFDDYYISDLSPLNSPIHKNHEFRKRSSSYSFQGTTNKTTVTMPLNAKPAHLKVPNTITLTATSSDVLPERISEIPTDLKPVLSQDDDFRERSRSVLSSKSYQRRVQPNNYFGKRESTLLCNTKRSRESSIYSSTTTATSGYCSLGASQLTVCPTNSQQEADIDDDSGPVKNNPPKVIVSISDVKDLESTNHTS